MTNEQMQKVMEYHKKIKECCDKVKQLQKDFEEKRKGSVFNGK